MVENIDTGKAFDLAVSLAREAGEMLLGSLGNVTEIELKGEINPVTELDRQVEEFLVSHIAREFPGHDFLAEERTNSEGNSEYRWIIDPLDGTTNYAHGYPCFAVSIALEGTRPYNFRSYLSAGNSGNVHRCPGRRSFSKWQADKGFPKSEFSRQFFPGYRIPL